MKSPGLSAVPRVFSSLPPLDSVFCGGLQGEGPKQHMTAGVRGLPTHQHREGGGSDRDPHRLLTTLCLAAGLLAAGAFLAVRGTPYLLAGLVTFWPSGVEAGRLAGRTKSKKSELNGKYNVLKQKECFIFKETFPKLLGFYLFFPPKDFSRP